MDQAQILDSVDLTPAQGLLRCIKEAYNPRQIWLFGSRARRTARPDSDWDVFVVLSDSAEDDLLDPLVAWDVRKRSGVPADIVPCRESDFHNFSRTVNTLSYEVAKYGVLVYER